MRVILTQNVPKLGEVGDVCNVAAGYGRNFLIPQRLAILATQGALRQVDDLKRTEGHRQDRIRSEMMVVAQRIAALRLPFTAKVGETGRLYGSITASDIAEAMEAELGEPVDRRKIMLDESIRTLGEHDVAIHLMPGLDAHLKVIVVADAERVQDIAVEGEAPVSPDDAQPAAATAPAAEAPEAEAPEAEDLADLGADADTAEG